MSICASIYIRCPFTTLNNDNSQSDSDRNVDWLEHSVRKLVHIHLQNDGESNLDKIKSHYSLPDIEILVEEAIETYSNESSKVDLIMYHHKLTDRHRIARLGTEVRY